MTSAPTTRAARARPASTWPAARERAERKPVQAAPTSTAPAPVAPTRIATWGAAWGWSSSGVKVATRTRSTSAGSVPASSMARDPARAERSTRLSPLTRRRRRTPVRVEIQSESIPSGAAISSFPTIRSGRPAAIEAIPGARVRLPFVLAPVARAIRPSGSTSDASTSKSCSCGSSGKGPLPARERFDLDSLDRPSDEPGDYLLGTDVEEARDAEIPKLPSHRRPADRADQRGCEGIPRVLGKEVGGGGGDDRSFRCIEFNAVQGGSERLHCGLHRLGVEGAGDREALRSDPQRLGGGVRGFDPLERPGEDELLR